MKTLTCLFAAALALATHAADSEPLASVEQVLAVLPKGLQLRAGQPSQPLAVAQANKVLAAKLFGRAAHLSLTFIKVEPPHRTPYGEAVLGMAQVQGLDVQGATMTAHVSVFFTPDQAETLATTDATHELSCTGTIGRAELSQDGEKLALDLVAATLGEVRPAVPQAKDAKVQVISAVYGGGKYQSDVTERVKKFVGEKHSYWINPTDLGADPTPGWGKTLTVVFNKDGVRRLQARTETEYVLPESFYMPQDAKELTEWLSGTHWYSDREFVFLPNGLFLWWGEAVQWRALSDSRVLITWNPDLKIECQFDFVWGSFKEQGGLNLTYKRVLAKP